MEVKMKFGKKSIRQISYNADNKRIYLERYWESCLKWIMNHKWKVFLEINAFKFIHKDFCLVAVYYAKRRHSSLLNLPYEINYAFVVIKFKIDAVQIKFNRKVIDSFYRDF